MQLIKVAQTQHGLRHNDYLRYRFATVLVLLSQSQPFHAFFFRCTAGNSAAGGCGGSDSRSSSPTGGASSNPKCWTPLTSPTHGSLGLLVCTFQGGVAACS